MATKELSVPWSAKAIQLNRTSPQVDGADGRLSQEEVSQGAARDKVSSVVDVTIADDKFGALG